jgi:integrase
MARTIRFANLESPTSRSRLKRGRQPHWQSLQEGVALGYQRAADAKAGRFVLRRYLGPNKYSVVPLGTADDTRAADGQAILSHAQALSRARAMIDKPSGRIERMTVRQGMRLYMEAKERLGQSVADVRSRGTAHILPPLGDLVIAELTATQLQKWLAKMAAAPAQFRPKAGKVNYRPAPETEEDVRKRRNTANRVLTMLKAVLNFAYDEGYVSARDAWGRKLKPFKAVDAARVRYLSIAEAKRLLNACDPEFRPLVRAALETGCRYMELARLEIADFNPDSGSLHLRKSKSAKARHVVLSEDGIAFFKTHIAGLNRTLMFVHDDGTPWKTAEQARPMAAATEAAKLKGVSLHTCRHTWASLSIMNGVPLMIIAGNLGHRDTRMVELHYGHLAPSFVTDAIRAGAPRYGAASNSNVRPLR